MSNLKLNFNTFLAFLLLLRSAFSQDGSDAVTQPAAVEEIPNEFEEYCGEHASLEFLDMMQRSTYFAFSYKYKDETPGFGSYVIKDTVKMHDETHVEYPTYMDITPYGAGKVEKAFQSNETSVKIKKNQEVQLEFIGGFSFARITDGLLLTGLNQQWLGCPLPLCIYAMLDAAYTLSSGTTYLVRGRYLWDLSKPPLYSNRILFNKENPKIQPYVDWALVFADEKYFGRDMLVFCQKENHEACEGTEGNFEMSSTASGVFEGKAFAPNDIIQAGFSILAGEGTEAQAFLVHRQFGSVWIRRFKMTDKNKQLHRFEDTFILNKTMLEEHARIDESILMQGVDAAFRKDDHVYFLSRNSYLKVNIENIIKDGDEYNVGSWFDGVDPKVSNEKELFNCPDDIYTEQEWVKDRDVYRSSFENLYNSPESEREVRKTLRYLRDGRPTRPQLVKESGSSTLPIALAIILTGVVVIVVAIIVTERRRRVKKKLRIVRLRKEALVDNRSAGKGGLGAHRSHLEDDEILDDTYIPGRKLKTIIKKVPGPGSQLSSTGSSIGSNIGSTTGKTSSSIKLVGSRALDEDLTLKPNMGSKIFTKKGANSSLATKISKGSQKLK